MPMFKQSRWNLTLIHLLIKFSLSLLSNFYQFLPPPPSSIELSNAVLNVKRIGRPSERHRPSPFTNRTRQSGPFPSLHTHVEARLDTPQGKGPGTPSRAIKQSSNQVPMGALVFESFSLIPKMVVCENPSLKIPVNPLFLKY